MLLSLLICHHKDLNKHIQCLIQFRRKCRQSLGLCKPRQIHHTKTMKQSKVKVENKRKSVKLKYKMN